ncbi:MAG: YitT family protein [Spirochaetales bacterium]|nr:YitT family protein [Spirochaetales bacterium]
MILNEIKNYIFITIGLFLTTFGWVAFLVPAQIVGGGVNGIAAIIYYITGFPMGISILIINIALVLLGMRILGFKFALSSIFGIVTMSLMFLVLPKFINEPIVTDRFMATLIGGALAGTGIGIAISSGGNSGGTDIIALIVTKYRNISPGRVILLLDVAIIASSYLLSQNLETVVFGYVEMAVVSYVIDLVIEGRKQSFQITVVSDLSTNIAERIGVEIGRGITLFKGSGWFSKKDKDIIICVCQRYDKQKILRIVDQEDPGAFITIGRVSAVFGYNFDRIKM